MIRALAVLLAAAVSSAHAQKQPVSGGRIAGEAALGFVGVPLGFAVGYTIGSGFRPHGSSNTGVALGFAGALLGPALGVSSVGSGGAVARKLRRRARRCGARLRRAVLRGSRRRESESNETQNRRTRRGIRAPRRRRDDRLQRDAKIGVILMAAKRPEDLLFAPHIKSRSSARCARIRMTARVRTPAARRRRIAERHLGVRFTSPASTVVAVRHAVLLAQRAHRLAERVAVALAHLVIVRVRRAIALGEMRKLLLDERQISRARR